jgi:hypothetical protein
LVIALSKSPKAKAGRRPGPYKTSLGQFREPTGSGDLQFGVGVGADFAVQVDLFVLRCGPFHGERSLGAVQTQKKNSTRDEMPKREILRARREWSCRARRVTKEKRKHRHKILTKKLGTTGRAELHGLVLVTQVQKTLR